MEYSNLYINLLYPILLHHEHLTLKPVSSIVKRFFLLTGNYAS